MTPNAGAVCHACGQTLPPAHDLSNPHSQTVTEALSRKCPIWSAQPGEPCVSTIRPEPLPGRLIHHARRTRD